VDAACPSLRHSVNVTTRATGSAANFSPQACSSDKLHRLKLALRNHSKTRLNHVNAKLIQTPRYTQFVFRR
jgi:hypothetical protein